MIVACLKWTARPGHDDDDRFAGVSAADQAALELALRLGAERNQPVVAVSAGPHGAEAALRNALACGATRAIRIDLATDADSRTVAAAISDVVGALAGRDSIVICGDYSIDRGTGSVPAFIAHDLGAAQALGLVAVDTTGTGSALAATRRLDGGRREVLSVPLPCVLSVEGSVAGLRRAGLKQTLASRTMPIEIHRCAPVGHDGFQHPSAPVSVAPFRPRARVMAAPVGADALDRLRALTDVAGAPTRGETVALAPSDAAARIVEALRAWGYIT